jgi:Holliday junction DNA helicase RuvA
VIGSLRGRVTEVLDGGELVVEVGGVGYRVTVPAPERAGLGVGEEVLLHVHTHVRDDAIVLYGFRGRETRRCFEALLGAHGVGPALALAVVSCYTPDELERLVAAGDVEALSAVPGIGRKTAARLVLELEARLGAGRGRGAAVTGRRVPEPLDEVREALASLGYGSDEVREALRGLPSEGSAEELLRSALRSLAGSRR